MCYKQVLFNMESCIGLDIVNVCETGYCKCVPMNVQVSLHTTCDKNENRFCLAHAQGSRCSTVTCKLSNLDFENDFCQGKYCSVKEELKNEKKITHKIWR